MNPESVMLRASGSAIVAAMTVTTLVVTPVVLVDMAVLAGAVVDTVVEWSAVAVAAGDKSLSRMQRSKMQERREAKTPCGRH